MRSVGLLNFMFKTLLETPNGFVFVKSEELFVNLLGRKTSKDSYLLQFKELILKFYFEKC